MFYTDILYFTEEMRSKGNFYIQTVDQKPTWSSVLLAMNNIKEVGAVVDRPKALGDIRGVTYIYGMFYRFGLIDMPDKVNGKMKRAGRQM